MAASYDICIERGKNNCSAYAPSLPGCVTTGKTVAETRARMREAIALHLEMMQKDGDDIPKLTCVAANVEAPPLSSATAGRRVDAARKKLVAAGPVLAG